MPVTNIGVEQVTYHDPALAYGPVSARRAEFLGCLAWYATLMGLAIVTLVVMTLFVVKEEGREGEERRAEVERSRRRLMIGAALGLLATALAIPRFGGGVLLAWIFYPVWYALERRRSLARLAGQTTRTEGP